MAELSQAKYRLPTVAVIPLASGVGNGGVVSWQPENQLVDHIIGQVVVDITTAQECQTLSIGTAATGDTPSINLINNLSTGRTGSFGSFHNFTQGRDKNGVALQHLSAGQFITASACNPPTTLAGNLYITFWPV